MEKYPPPDNCPLLKAPSVNVEVAAAVRELETRRDQKLVGQQSQIGSALASLGQGGGGANHPLIELASDTSRLLLDLHYKYSAIRTELLMLGLRKDLKDTLVSGSRHPRTLRSLGLELKVKPPKPANKPPNPNTGKPSQQSRETPTVHLVVYSGHPVGVDKNSRHEPTRHEATRPKGQRTWTVVIDKVAATSEVEHNMTSRPNREQPIIALPFYEADKAICVATTLLFYINVTGSIRSPESDRLFITFKKPHHNASSQTISRWIRNVLSKAGIDSNRYTPHSTRHASTSLADRKG
nr:unnamed protein product [Callosobruchus analis]